MSHPLRSNVVDYFIVSESISSNILFFKVHTYLIDSGLSNKHKTPDKYIWNGDSKYKFRETLASPVFQQEIKHFNASEFNNDSDVMLQSLNSIIHKVVNISVKKVFDPFNL